MSKLSVRQIMKRHEQAQMRKDNWRQIYEDCYEFALPQRNLYDGYYEGGGSPGQNKMARVFDSTAINATQRFANRIQAGLFPPYGQWCRLEPGPDIPADRAIEAQAILDAYSEKMFAVLRQSNFDLANRHPHNIHHTSCAVAGRTHSNLHRSGANYPYASALAHDAS